MNQDKRLNLYVQDSSNVFAENRLLRYAVVIMLAVTLVNSVALARLKDSLQTHIIPVGSSSNFILTGSSGNDDYLKAMTRYVIHMAGDLTAATARQQFSELLSLWHASTYAEYQQRFNELSDSLERYPSVSYQAVWTGNSGIQISGDRLRVSVIKKKMVGDTVARKSQLDYEIRYRIEAGRFYILSLQEVGGEAV